jgi:CDP-diacylglycerol--glycerol-3-phosphate 3-phosphatidyltransferase
VFDGRWRGGVERMTAPVGRQLVRLGVTADILTASGLAFAVATSLVVATGHLLIGIPLLALTGFHDLFDGPVAKAAGTASVRGALFDSVMDRVADAVLMAGVAWYLVSVREGELALLPLVVLGAASLVSYVRAKADALGLPVTNGGLFGGLMERAERMILLGVGFLEPWLLVPVLWILFGLTMLTAIARFVTAWRSAQGPLRAAGQLGAEGQLGAASPLEAARTARTVRQERVRFLRTQSARRPGREARSARWRARTESPAVSGAGGEPGGRWRVLRQEVLEGRGARARARRARADAARSQRLTRASHGLSRAPHGAAGDPGDRGV